MIIYVPKTYIFIEQNTDLKFDPLVTFLAIFFVLAPMPPGQCMLSIIVMLGEDFNG